MKTTFQKRYGRCPFCSNASTYNVGNKCLSNITNARALYKISIPYKLGFSEISPPQSPLPSYLQILNLISLFIIVLIMLIYYVFYCVWQIKKKNKTKLPEWRSKNMRQLMRLTRQWLHTSLLFSVSRHWLVMEPSYYFLDWIKTLRVCDLTTLSMGMIF